MTAASPETEYFAHLSAGRFMLQRSVSSGAYIFYPRVAAPVTGATDLEWVEASGRGVVYSTTLIRQKPPAPAYNVALIDLQEGPRLLSRVEGIPTEQVKIGMQVQAHIIRDGDVPVLVFVPVQP